MGWRARFALARGQTINDVINKLPAIESGLGTFRGAARVVPTPDDLANRFELRILDKDPHADAITWREDLAAKGLRVWELSPDRPALVIVVDEYAGLAENAPDAAADADSIARRGRAVAVTLIAATQRPTQKAMGQGALRSQMDVRICFRVRERRDVDLILGQGMLATGWQAYTLNAPGKFLISAPEHDIPRRARAYLITDEAVAETASRHAAIRPSLDQVSVSALDENAHRQAANRAATPGRRDSEEIEGTPEALLWAALSLAPDQGVTVPDLMSETGMSRRWVYYRLRDLADAGQAIQTERGTWRLTEPGDDAP